MIDPLQNGITAYLLADQLLDIATAQDALQQAKMQRLLLPHYLVKNKILDGVCIAQSCARHMRLPYFDLQYYDPAWLSHSSIDAEFIIRHRLLPLYKEEHYLYIGMTDPNDYTTLEMVHFHAGHPIRIMLIADDALENIIAKYIEANFFYSQLTATLLKLDAAHEHTSPSSLEENNDETVIDFVDHLIKYALQQSASDIHLEPYASYCRIRFRREGLLHQVTELPLPLATRVVARLKIMAKLDIAEKRLPQDGRLEFETDKSGKKSGKIVDIRLTTCPTLFGEKIVLRLLDTEKVALSLDALGMNEHQQKIFNNHLSKTQGLILVTGPTGSGKTVTLYSALQSLNCIEKNILTVEDPVEIQIPGINQINIQAKIGWCFASALRALLRQDPDIIMIGEIRDLETATIAVQAAQTGHLVLSTLHTSSALETLSRLQLMGMPAYHLIHSLTLIIAQRLVRKKCVRCYQHQRISQLQPHYPDNNHCHHGYQGRIGIFELLPITENLATLLLNNATPVALLAQARLDGFVTLYDAGLEKIRENITDLTEINRVITPC